MVLLASGLVALCGCSGPHAEAEKFRLLTYNASDGIRTLDPAKAMDLETMWAVDQLYEGLLELDADLKVVPALAQTWSVSDDGLVYAFKLRDARFHDGTLLRANDVAMSFERLLDPAEALPGRWVLRDLHSTSGVEVISEDSLHLNLAQANPVFAGLLATTQASILKGGGWGGDPDTGDLGTGPFVLRGWLPETAMVLHANPGYWMRDSAGAVLPYIDGVRLEFNREEGAEMLGFRQGRYDFVSAPSAEWMEVFFDGSGAWKPEWKGRFVRHTTPYLKTDYIGISLDSLAMVEQGFPVLPLGVRRAMSMALDRAELVRELRAGGAAPAMGFVPPGMPGFSELDRPVMFELEHRADSARWLLVQHGIDEDSRLTGLVLGTKPATADLAAALQHTWSEFGLDVAIDVAPSALDAERVAKSQVPLFRKSWLADYADAENFLSLFDSQRWAPKGPNYTHFSDSNVDMWLSQAAQMNEGEERQALMREIEQRVMSQMPLIPLWHDEVLHLVSSEWTGWQISATNRLDLRKVRLSGQAPSVN